MTAPLIVQVTQDHIDRGSRGMATSCPIALAITETTGASWAEVGSDNDLIDTDDHAYRLTTKGIAFITRFDAGLPVRPTTFRFFAHPAFD